MIYLEHLPSRQELNRLIGEVKEYPISGRGVVQYAEHQGYDDDVLSYLKLFYRPAVFSDKSELLNTYDHLEKLIAEEGHSMNEDCMKPEW